MFRNLLLFILLLLAAEAAAAQTVSPTPRPTPGDSDTVRISTNLIQLDVTVTDSKGKVISDLKPEEIEVYENGEKQKISNFNFISNVKSTEIKPNPADKTEIPIPTATLRPEQIHRTIALVVDDLSLSFESAYQTRRALKKYVDEQMQDGDLVAIIRTGAGIGALQQFTSDRKMLYAAIERVKWNPLGSGGISAFAPIEDKPPDDALKEPEDTDQKPVDPVKRLEDFRSTVFATGTLGALRYVVSGMQELPGRKSVILFSDGFKLYETDDSGFKETGRVMDFLRQLIDVANRASVVFYTVDARGLVYTGLTAADSPDASNPANLGDAVAKRNEQLFDTQSGLSFLADETGGFAIKNNNDLSGGVRKILDDQSYYLIAYQPDTDTFDAVKRKFNKLEVKVKRPGLQVRYRSGFFNVADKERVKTASTATPAAQLNTALVSPFAVGGITLRLNTLFGADAKIGTFVRSLLHVNAGDLQFTDDKDGVKKAVIEVLAASFGDNGQVVDQIGKSYTITAAPAVYQKLLENGFVYNFTFPVKKAGGYQYRVAIRDAASGRLGSASQFIDVPDVKKNVLTASSIVLESLTENEYQKMMSTTGQLPITNPLSDTALRRLKLGTVLRYGYEIYNAKLDAAKVPQVQTKIRVFRDRTLVLDGKTQTVNVAGQTDLAHIRVSGALAIGQQMVPGDYILQIIVTDPLAKRKNQIATQYVQFEVVE